jgi:dTDP-4-amino-4,6-dideoxygalactose transaminase
MRKINLSKPYITVQCIDEVVSVLKSGWLTQGKKVSDFENEIKKELHTKYALAVNSATSGLHIALLSLGIGKGDEVIIPSFTWVATANVVELCGAKPIFVDIDCDTLNANLYQILSKVNKKTKAVIIVHLFGKPFDILALRSKLSSEIFIVEDAACALGALMGGNACGTIGNVGVFSFHPRKSITTGEGGMVVTNESALYEKMSMLRNHGQNLVRADISPSAMYDCPIVGFNYRMTDIQAALGLQQFLQLEKFIEDRKKLASEYARHLLGCKFIKLPFEGDLERHSWQSYVIFISYQERRDEIMLKLANDGIETRPGTHAVHTLSYFKEKYNLLPEDFPTSYSALKSTISLPLHNNMTHEDVRYVSEKFLEIVYAL